MNQKLPPTPPQAALPDGESNRYLAKFKTSLSKRWSVTKSETLYEIFDLAMFLWALERSEESLSVATVVATAIPAPPPLPRERVNYNIWCPATYSHALVVHLGDRQQREQASTSRAALFADPGIARDNPGYLAEKITTAGQQLTAPANPKEMKWESRGLARSAGVMLLFSELAAAGDTLFAPYAKDAACLLPQLRTKLGDRLRNG